MFLAQKPHEILHGLPLDTPSGFTLIYHVSGGFQVSLITLTAGLYLNKASTNALHLYGIFFLLVLMNMIKVYIIW